MRRCLSVSWGIWLGLAWLATPAMGAPVYKCPGPPVLYTDAISPKEAKDKGCISLESTPVTVIGAPPKGRGPMPAPSPAASGSPAPGGSRIDPAEQKARDSDRKQILVAELKKEEQSLAVLQAEYNNGEPERRGDEKNYQKYLDRVAELKAGIARKESDVAALKRELAKLP